MASYLRFYHELREDYQVALNPFAVLMALSLAFATVRLVIRPHPVGDFSGVWQHQAQTILNGGVPYADAWDNKTPLWQYIHVLTSFTPNRHHTFVVLIAISNGVSAWLLGRLGQKFELTHSVVIVGALYLVLIGNFRGYTVNSRQFATMFLLLALYARRPLVIGALTALACLMHQYYGLLIPVVVIYHWWFEDADRTISWLSRFSVAGLSLVVVTYLSLLYWGLPALWAAIDTSVLGLMPYLERGAATGDAIWRDPSTWLNKVTRPIRRSTGLMAIGVVMLWLVRNLAGTPQRSVVARVVPDCRDSPSHHQRRRPLPDGSLGRRRISCGSWNQRT